MFFFFVSGIIFKFLQLFLELQLVRITWDRTRFLGIGFYLYVYCITFTCHYHNHALTS